MTNIKYDGLVEEIRTETKFLDELLKTDTAIEYNDEDLEDVSRFF
nr:MAG TPA: hypothetical protein [Caudoviricetes sp.]